MDLKIIPAADHYIHVALSGKLDKEAVETTGKDLTELLKEGEKPVIVDVTQISSIAPEGVKFLLDLAQTQCCMVLYNPQPVIREHMETAGCAAPMFLESNLSDALARMEQSRNTL